MADGQANHRQSYEIRCSAEDTSTIYPNLGPNVKTGSSQLRLKNRLTSQHVAGITVEYTLYLLYLNHYLLTVYQLGSSSKEQVGSGVKAYKLVQKQHESLHYLLVKPILGSLSPGKQVANWEQVHITVLVITAWFLSLASTPLHSSA